MELKKLFSAVILAAAVTVASGTASANTGAYNAFNDRYVTNSTCTTCHTGSPGAITALGTDWKTFGGTNQTAPTDWTSFDAIYATAYGGVDPNAPTTSANQGTATVGGCITASSTAPLMMLFAILTLGFFIRRK